ncbi:hypothetical protein OE88DRAFT_1340856 [Heliocybe sulcata]|uniref:Uncharacterized protein n=1 Tax=Heliocybe sulcata TaxID=5364 RepID=A0A5C3N7P4_9AGAM|nr:hypothetical protein OE88DRAFT_1340856 [Heliocybe sulcata]
MRHARDMLYFPLLKARDCTWHLGRYDLAHPRPPGKTRMGPSDVDRHTWSRTWTFNRYGRPSHGRTPSSVTPILGQLRDVLLHMHRVLKPDKQDASPLITDISVCLTWKSRAKMWMCSRLVHLPKRSRRNRRIVARMQSTYGQTKAHLETTLQFPCAK